MQPRMEIEEYRRLNHLVDTLKATRSPASVRVSLLEDWSNDGKPQESITYTNGYRPDHDIAIIPFTRLPWWYYRISTAYSAVIATEQELPDESQSLLYKSRKICTSNEWCRIARASRHWLTDTRIVLDTKLDDIPGKTAGALRLERFQNWFQDDWVSEYENRFTADIQKHMGFVLKHDPRLVRVRRRHYLAIMLHHTYRASHDDPEKVEDDLKKTRPRLYSKWDPQVWSDYWGDCMPSLSYRFFADGKMDQENRRRVYRLARRALIRRKPIDNNEDLNDITGPVAYPHGDMHDLEMTVRSTESYTLYGDYMGHVWNCLELNSRDIDGFWPSGVVAVAEKLTQEEGLLPDDQKADRSHWTRLVKLWNECGSYLEDMRKSAPETSLSPVQDASRFLASPPQNAKEKE
ncbi:hypothetical protein N7527_000180 [Penicillium freii]|nr:hypothetical protein N7527_000180 [Penicillium freii]